MWILQKIGQWVANAELRRVWPKTLRAAWIDISELQIKELKEFYREMAAWVFSESWASARLWELYVRGDWNPENWLDDFFARLTGSDKAMDIINNHPANRLFDRKKRKQTRTPETVWQAHYDIPVELYEIMLGQSMKYTSPEWNESLWEFDLDTNQKLAMEMICQRAELEKSREWEQQMKVLEIGFWYGTLASHMIQNYWVHVTGLTVSDGQMDYAKKYMIHNETIQNADLQNLDWKVIMKNPELMEMYKWKFDRIISIEMIEAVSTRDLPDFFLFLFHCLSDDGILFIHAINSPRNFETTEWFIDSYIFPDGVVPQHQNILACAQKAGFQQSSNKRNIVTQAYDKALMAWSSNLEWWYDELADKLDFHYSRNHTPAFPYPDSPSFLKIFEYYLKSCAGSFRSGYNRDGQYKFYKSSRAQVQSIVPATLEQTRHILETKYWWESLPK